MLVRSDELAAAVFCYFVGVASVTSLARVSA